MMLVSAALSAPALAQHASATHGDHNPHHGGAVNMYDMLHYEVVLIPAGGLRVYFTDEMRRDLPATAVSNVRVEIVRPKVGIEPVAMQVNATGDFWQGRSKPVSDVKSVVRLGFVFRGEAALVEIDGDAWPQLTKAGAKTGTKTGAKTGAAGMHDGH
jgi:hypothetical protein